jgi:hypothetical protein
MDRVRDLAKGKWLEEVPSTEKEKEKEKKKKKKKPSAEQFELWEIGPSGAAPDSSPEEEPVRPKKPVTAASFQGRRDHDHCGRSVPSVRALDADDGMDSTNRGASATVGHATPTAGRGGGNYGGGSAHDGGSGGSECTGGR